MILACLLGLGVGLFKSTAHSATWSDIAWWGNRNGSVQTQETTRNLNSMYDAFIGIWGWGPGGYFDHPSGPGLDKEQALNQTVA